MNSWLDCFDTAQSLKAVTLWLARDQTMLRRWYWARPKALVARHLEGWDPVGLLTFLRLKSSGSAPMAVAV